MEVEQACWAPGGHVNQCNNWPKPLDVGAKPCHTMTMNNETAMTALTEDNVSDLLWLVTNYGHKLTEVDNALSPSEVEKLTQTLETMLNEMG